MAHKTTIHPRSSLLSQAVINQAPTRQLKSVIARFHNQVSSYRIHRYDVFRRRAFDHDLMRRVFEDWEEGIAFYRDCYSKEGTPYILQQGGSIPFRETTFSRSVPND